MNRSLFLGSFLGGACLVMATLASQPIAAPVAPVVLAAPNTSSISNPFPIWRRNDIRTLTIAGVRYSAPSFVFIEAEFVAGECAVEAQIADLVSDPQHQCFDKETYSTGRGRVLVPVPADPERVVRPSHSSRWHRVSQLRTSSSRRRPSRS
jgi:hypothetical protein